MAHGTLQEWMKKLDYREVQTRQKTKNPFEKVDLQLATLVKSVPEGKEWIYEIKYDGYRTIAFCEYGKTKLISRNGIDFSKKFASIIPSLNELSQDHSFVLDGEMVVFDKNGRSNFSELQSEIKKRAIIFLMLCSTFWHLTDKI